MGCVYRGYILPSFIGYREPFLPVVGACVRRRRLWRGFGFGRLLLSAPLPSCRAVYFRSATIGWEIIK